MNPGHLARRTAAHARTTGGCWVLLGVWSWAGMLVVVVATAVVLPVGQAGEVARVARLAGQSSTRAPWLAVARHSPRQATCGSTQSRCGRCGVGQGGSR